MRRYDGAALESSLAAAYRQRPTAADANAPDLPLLASMAKAYCSDAFFACAGEAIQLHGGVGFTWEYDPHLFFKLWRGPGMTLLGDLRFRIASASPPVSPGS